MDVRPEDNDNGMGRFSFRLRITTEANAGHFNALSWPHLILWTLDLPLLTYGTLGHS